MPGLLAAAQHVDERQGALAQGDGFKARWWLMGGQGFRDQGLAKLLLGQQPQNEAFEDTEIEDFHSPMGGTQYGDLN